MLTPRCAALTASASRTPSESEPGVVSAFETVRPPLLVGDDAVGERAADVDGDPIAHGAAPPLRRRSASAPDLRPPHTSSAVSTIRRSFAACSSGVRSFPSIVEAKPHWGERQSWSTSTNLDASSIAPLEVVLRLELAGLRRHEPEHDQLALGDESQRLEPARPLVVELDEEAVDVEPSEQRLADEVVAPLGGPRGAVVAAAHVRRDRHAGAACARSPR